MDGSAYCDLIWSDPICNDKGEMVGKTVYNESRDCSIVFGAELVKEFLAFNQLSTIIRGHEVFLEGFRTYDWGEIKPTPSVITVFSAPNYCGTCGNKAAVLKIEVLPIISRITHSASSNSASRSPKSTSSWSSSMSSHGPCPKS